MSWEDQQGALIAARDVEPQSARTALELSLADLGFAVNEGESHFSYYQNERALGLLGRMSRAMARAIALRLAARLGEPVLLLHAHAVYRPNTKPACRFDAMETGIDPVGRMIAARPSALEDVPDSDDWLDTDKPWRLAEYALGSAQSLWIPGRLDAPVQHETWRLRAPASLADARLDAIVIAIRSGAVVERTSVGGRDALRVREVDGTTAVSVLSAEQIAIVRAACPSASF